MTAIQPEYCVEIRVPTLSDDEDEFGSGYTLGPHWVLTAHHVLFPEQLDNSSKFFTITWWNETGEQVKSGKPTTVERKKIVWYNKKHDLALIHCLSPYKGVPSAWDLFVGDAPNKMAGKTCRCAGFLSNLCDENGNQRRKEPEGTLGIPSPQGKIVDINGLNVVMNKSEYWQGFSGSPVFVGDKLIGVVRTTNTGENSLSASLINMALNAKGKPKKTPLRDVPDFFVPPERDCWDRLRPGIVKAFEEDQNVYKAVRDECRKLPEKNPAINKPTELAEILYRMSEQDVVTCFFKVYSFMRQNENVMGIKTMQTLACDWLVLIASEQCSISGIAAFKGNVSTGPFDVKAVEPVLVNVEAQAANGENRTPKLQLKGEQLCSPFDLTPGCHTGLDNDDGLAASDVRNKCSLKTVPGLKAFSIEDVKTELEKLSKRLGAGILSLPKDNKNRGKLIDYLLELGRPDLPGSYYVRLSESDILNEHSDLHKLREWCSQLLLFNVSEVENFNKTKSQMTLHVIIQNALEFQLNPNNT